MYVHAINMKTHTQPNTPHMTTAVVAEFLLRNEYLLTALEFYQVLT